MKRAFAIFGLLALITGINLSSTAAARQTQQFRLEEATVRSIHEAFRSGELTCAQLTQMYLNRIRAYDAQGPSLASIINVNPRAMEEAAALDAKYRQNASSTGSLHCIPIF